MILLPDPGAARFVWELSYSDLAAADMAALQFLYSACCGPLRAFTFIDPTDNMLAWSSDFAKQTWQISSEIKVSSGAQDPEGNNAAFTVTNLGQAPEQISQILAVPASYRYCFSVYALANRTSNITLALAGASAQASKTFVVGPNWARLSFAEKLADPGFTLTVSISLDPGQQVQLYGIQLEPQLAPSRYRPTGQRGGVYPNAHWATDEFVVAAQATNLFSTAFSIETSI